MRRYCPKGHDKEEVGTYRHGDVERCRECRRECTRTRDRIRRELHRQYTESKKETTA